MVVVRWLISRKRKKERDFLKMVQKMLRMVQKDWKMVQERTKVVQTLISLVRHAPGIANFNYLFLEEHRLGCRPLPLFQSWRCGG